MSYRPGVYVVDRRTNRLGRVVGGQGAFTRLRPPGGGEAWDCPTGYARLATEREQRTAGIAALGTDQEVSR